MMMTRNSWGRDLRRQNDKSWCTKQRGPRHFSKL